MNRHISFGKEWNDRNTGKRIYRVGNRRPVLKIRQIMQEGFNYKPFCGLLYFSVIGIFVIVVKERVQSHCLVEMKKYPINVSNLVLRLARDLSVCLCLCLYLCLCLCLSVCLSVCLLLPVCLSQFGFISPPFSVFHTLS